MSSIDSLCMPLSPLSLNAIVSPLAIASAVKLFMSKLRLGVPVVAPPAKPLLEAVVIPSISPLLEETAAQVRPPAAPLWACRKYPFVGVLETLRLSSSTTLEAITVPPSAVEVTSPVWLGCSYSLSIIKYPLVKELPSTEKESLIAYSITDSRGLNFKLFTSVCL